MYFELPRQVDVPWRVPMHARQSPVACKALCFALSAKSDPLFLAAVQFASYLDGAPASKLLSYRPFSVLLISFKDPCGCCPYLFPCWEPLEEAVSESLTSGDLILRPARRNPTSARGHFVGRTRTGTSRTAPARHPLGRLFSSRIACCCWESLGLSYQLLSPQAWLLALAQGVKSHCFPVGSLVDPSHAAGAFHEVD